MSWSAQERSTHAPTMAALALAAPARHATLPALRHKPGAGWDDVSFAELGERARTVARGLIALGVAPGDRVAILSETRIEWTCADLGALAAAAVVVPVYPTNPPEDCAYVLEHSGATVVFVDTPAQAAKVLPLAKADGPLEHVIAFEPTEGALSLDGLAERGAAVDGALVDERAAAVEPGDLCTLIYTSGTTGRPKGCMLSHGNLRANLDMIEAVVPSGERPVLFAFLPLAHALTRMLQMYAVDVGGTLAYWDGTRETLLPDLAEVRPTQLPSVPRLYEKVHTRIEAGLEEASPFKRRLFHFAVAAGREAKRAERSGERIGPLLRARLAIADRLVLSKVRDAFGGRLEIASTGAAPLDPEVLELFHACGIPVMEGYGLTESTAVTTINTPAALSIGTVGRPLPGSELRIAPEDGEVLIRGPHLFGGYYRDPEATAEVLRDGWLHSGDLGTLDSAGFLTIVGRKKDIIITSSGKNVAPSRIEDALRRHRWISQAVVYGDRRPYLVALLTLDPEEAPEPDDPRVRAELQEAVDEVNASVSRAEQVKRFALLPRDLSQDDGELTPTMKLKRAVIYRRYAAEIDALYESGEGAATEPVATAGAAR